MDQLPLISVIIPSYNSSFYIKKCLKSILKQNYRNLEVIVVNDGSTDKTEDEMKKYLNDKRVKYLFQKNKGVSSARNYGMSEASGEYFIFVDADDFLPQGAIKALVDSALAYNSDFVFGQVKSINVGKTVIYCKNSELKIFGENSFESKNYFAELISGVGPWGKLFKASVIRENKISFESDIKFGEDQIFLWTFLYYSNIFSSTSTFVYHYTQLNPNRACGKLYLENYKWNYLNLTCIENLFINRFHIDDLYKRLVLEKCSLCMQHYLDHAISIPSQHLDEYIGAINTQFISFLEPYLSSKETSDLLQDFNKTVDVKLAYKETFIKSLFSSCKRLLRKLFVQVMRFWVYKIS